MKQAREHIEGNGVAESARSDTGLAGYLAKSGAHFVRENFIKAGLPVFVNVPALVKVDFKTSIGSKYDTCRSRVCATFSGET